MTVAINDRQLTTLAARYAAELPWRPWFTPRSRWAKRVHVASDHEVWLLAWLPGQGTDLHDHGGTARPAAGAFALARGQLTEYTVAPGEPPRLDSAEHVAGGPGHAVGERAVHAMVNTGSTPAVSVHVYTPRLEMMRRYLFDECGLWLASMRRAGADW